MAPRGNSYVEAWRSGVEDLMARLNLIVAEAKTIVLNDAEEMGGSRAGSHRQGSGAQHLAYPNNLVCYSVRPSSRRFPKDHLLKTFLLIKKVEKVFRMPSLLRIIYLSVWKFILR